MTSHTLTFVDEQGNKEKARRHQNPDGTKGGWVATSASVHPTAIVDVDAIVEPGRTIGPGEYVPNATAIPITVDEFNVAILKAS